LAGFTSAIILAMIALLIHWSISSFGLVGAMLVTVLALALGKAIGLGAAASMWHVGVGRLLPWRPLWLIVVVSLTAALPALAVAYGLQTAPFLRILAIGTVYGFAYAAMALGVGLISPHERAALTQVMGRLQFMLPVVSTQDFVRCDVCGIVGIVSHKHQAIDVEGCTRCARRSSLGAGRRRDVSQRRRRPGVRRLSIIDLETVISRCRMKTAQSGLS
jgi:hypothetical protein